MSVDVDISRAKRDNITPQDAEDLKIVNEALDGLFKRGTFVSRDPYVLTIPQDNKLTYRHRNQYQATQYTHNTPFYYDDQEESQYQTYKYYEPGRTLFEQFPSTAQTKPSSIPSTPGNAPKKVMSLSAYKSKQKIGSSPTRKEEDVNAVAQERAKAESAEILADVEKEARDEEAPIRSEGRSDSTEVQDTRRKRAANGAPKIEPPPKRSRADAQDSQRQDVEPQESTVRDMPRKLSPLREKEMPTRLSPTLPSNVEAALLERKRRKSRSLENGHGTLPANGKLESDQERPAAKIVKLPLKKAVDAATTLNDRPPTAKDNLSSAQAKPRTVPKDVQSKTNDSAVVKEHQRVAQTPPLETDSTLEAQKMLTPSVRKTLLTNGAIQSPEPNTPLADVKQRSLKTALQQKWAAEQKRFEDKGRKLKHAASASAGDPPSALAATRALQSFMCYMLAFTCADQVSLTAEPKQSPAVKPWRSLGPFVKFVQGHCAPFPALNGLASMLCQVCNSHLLQLIESSPPDMPTRETMIAVTTVMRNATQQAYTQLGESTLKRDFPKAWKARFKDSMMLDDDLKVGRLLQGEYQLPASLLTTPAQVVRATSAVLDEWMEQQGLEEPLEADLKW